MANGANPFSERPEVAVAAMAAIASWSHAEYFFMHLYVTLAGGAQSDAATVFLAIETAGAKTAVVSALAAKKLSPDMQALLSIITKLAKTAEKDRNKLAHWTWGYSPDIPDGLLISNPKDDFNDDDPNNQSFQHRNNKLRANIFVYKTSELEKLRLQFHKIGSFIYRFNSILLRGGEDIYDKLCLEPEIAEMLNRQAKRDQSPPEEAPQ